MTRLSRLSVLAIAAVLSQSAFAWSDIGHGVISTIAYRHLDPAVRTKVDELLKIGVEERFRNVIMASNWADEVRSQRQETGPWHYKDLYFRADGKPTNMQPDKENVVTALANFRYVLGKENATQEARAEAMRWVMHFVEDAHQPLHAESRITDKLPKGDRGGNDFPIKPGNGLPDWNTNLHRVWDAGCGLFAAPMRAGEPGAEALILQIADKVEKEYPRAKLKTDVEDLSPDSWIKSGFEIAKAFCYTTPEGGTPSRNYVKRGQDICSHRSALAAYRLAAILNKSLK